MVQRVPSPAPASPLLGSINCGGRLVPTTFHPLGCGCASCVAVRRPSIGADLGRGDTPLDRFWRALRAGEPVSRALVTAGYREPAPPMPEEVKALLRESARARAEVRKRLQARRRSS